MFQRGCTFGEGQVKELLKGTNVPLGNSEAQYDIENTSTWSLGGQRIFLRKTSYLSSTLIINMKFRPQIGKSPYSPENTKKKDISMNFSVSP